MKVTTFFNTQGGVRRSTLAREVLDGLARRRVQAMGFDQDAWPGLRFAMQVLTSMPPCRVVHLDAGDLARGRLDELTDVEHVVIDTQKVPTLYREALEVSDVIVVPVWCDSIDELRELTLEEIAQAQGKRREQGLPVQEVLVVFQARQGVSSVAREDLLALRESMSARGVACINFLETIVPFAPVQVDEEGRFLGVYMSLRMIDEDQHSVLCLERFIDEILLAHGEARPIMAWSPDLISTERYAMAATIADVLPMT